MAASQAGISLTYKPTFIHDNLEYKMGNKYYYALPFFYAPTRIVLSNLPDINIKYVNKKGNSFVILVNGTEVILDKKLGRQFIRDITINPLEYGFKAVKVTNKSIIFSVLVRIAFPTYNEDIDYNLLLQIPHTEINKVCELNTYTNKLCGDNELWRHKLEDELKAVLPQVEKKVVDYRRAYNELLKKKTKRSKLLISSQYGWVPLIKLFLDQGVDIHDSNGIFLEKAARRGHLGAMKYLIARGLDSVDELTNALHKAAFSGHIEAAELLIKHGVDLHEGDDSVLKYAARGDMLIC